MATMLRVTVDPGVLLVGFEDDPDSVNIPVSAYQFGSALHTALRRDLPETVETLQVLVTRKEPHGAQVINSPTREEFSRLIAWVGDVREQLWQQPERWVCRTGKK